MSLKVCGGHRPPLQSARVNRSSLTRFAWLSIAAAILTPPDPISMLMMLVPMVILYEMSIWLSYVVLRRKKAKEAESEGG